MTLEIPLLGYSAQYSNNMEQNYWVFTTFSNDQLTLLILILWRMFVKD